MPYLSTQNRKEPGSLPAPGLFLLQNPADALFGQMVFSAECRNTRPFRIVVADVIIAVFQFRFIACFLAPFVPGARFAGDVDVHAIGVLLDLSDQIFRQDFFCFYIAHGCLLKICFIRKASAIQNQYSIVLAQPTLMQPLHNESKCRSSFFRDSTL